jgi:hypothetical protein
MTSRQYFNLHAQPARRSKTHCRHVTDDGVQQHARSPRFDGDGIVDRPIAQGKQGHRAVFKGGEGQTAQCLAVRTRRPIPLQRLVRLLFEQDTEQEQVQGGDRPPRLLTSDAARVSQAFVLPMSAW